MTATAVKGALAERLTPALHTIEGNVREARRAIAEGRHAAEDFLGETVLKIRRHPFRTVAWAAAAGALAGGVMGVACGWCARRRMWS
jgi:hypothetical protein